LVRLELDQRGTPPAVGSRTSTFVASRSGTAEDLRLHDRDRSTWIERHLGSGWVEVEAGIYELREAWRAPQARSLRPLEAVEPARA
jgi:hypothetical protein